MSSVVYVLIEQNVLPQGGDKAHLHKYKAGKATLLNGSPSKLSLKSIQV